MYPHRELVNDSPDLEIYSKLIRLPGFQDKRAKKITSNLIDLTKKTYPVSSSNSIESSEAKYYAQRLIDLNKKRKNLIDQMVKIAKSLPQS
nr:hypothetical protein [Lactobacillus intestinalis]